MLKGHKPVLKPKPYVAWPDQLSTALNTTSSVKRSLCKVSLCHSYLVTISSLCIFLTLQSVLNQSLTCQPPSPSCRIPMTLDTLKKNCNHPLWHILQRTLCYMLTIMGSIPLGTTCITVVRMVNRIYMEIIWTHTTLTSLAVPIKTQKKLMQVETCSLKLIGELMKPIQVDT